MKHYVYQHRRTDTNEIFYVGIGTKSSRNYKTHFSSYYRAFRTKDRNNIWQRIVNKTTYEVEIVFESNSYDEIRLKEIELISLYGKKINKGILSNITDGGEGTLGIKRPKGEESKFSKVVYQYDLQGNFIKEWSCAQDVERELGFYANSICNCCNKTKHKTAYKYQWSYIKINKMPNVYKPTKIKNIKEKAIVLFDIYSNQINEFPSLKEGAKYFNISPTIISNNLKGRSIKTKQGVWKYKI